MELLVFKVGDNYLRFIDDEYFICNINKAGVFPISEKNVVLERLKKIKNELVSVEVKKLTITESDYL